ncbi:MAG: lysophospholipid acyltransferase family protein [Ignavibacteria bacterium]
MNFLFFLLFAALEKTVPIFPLRLTYFLARFYGKFFYYFIPIRKKTAVNNLKLAFPGKSDIEIKKIVKGAYVNIFIVIFEFFYFPKLSDEKIKDIIQVTNLDIIREKLKNGKGLILICAHFGNWELAAFGVSRLCGEPFNVIVKEQENKLVDKRINRIREFRGNKMIYMEQSLREIITLLKNNKIVAMLGDQSAPRESTVKVDFFIKNVPAFEGAARFALKTGANILFGVPMRNKDYTYSITLKDIDTGKYKEYSEENIRKLTQEHTNLLVEYIKAYPDHWLWFHRRFKNVDRTD